MKATVLIICLSFSFLFTFGQKESLDPIPLDDAWKEKIWKIAPESTQVPISKKHNVLLFSMFTGFEHWAIPHVDYVITTLGEKTGAFEIMHSNDIAMFEKYNLSNFDAIVLNNNCSMDPKRDLFYDALDANTELSEGYKRKKALELESNLIEYIEDGGGLVIIHGGIVMQNNSELFSEMAGGSFDYHPPQQHLEIKVFEKDHPLTLPFDGQSFKHIDEAYFFKNAYATKNFKPLLYMETSKILDLRGQPDDKLSYVSWIKRFGRGRVFYCSPSHNAQSYEQQQLLKYYLNGIQYALGDLNCDDSPLEE